MISGEILERFRRLICLNSINIRIKIRRRLCRYLNFLDKFEILLYSKFVKDKKF